MFMPENAAFCYPLHEKCGLADRRRKVVAHVQEPLPEPAAEPQVTEPQVTEPRVVEPQVTEPGAAAVRPAVVWSRYAGSMLLHAFFTRCAAGTVLAAAGDPR